MLSKQEQLRKLEERRREFANKHLRGFWEKINESFTDQAEQEAFMTAFYSKTGPSGRHILAETRLVLGESVVVSQAQKPWTRPVPVLVIPKCR